MYMRLLVGFSAGGVISDVLVIAIIFLLFLVSIFIFPFIAF